MSKPRKIEMGVITPIADVTPATSGSKEHLFFWAVRNDGKIVAFMPTAEELQTMADRAMDNEEDWPALKNEIGWLKKLKLY